ncbi:MAG: TIGR03435 family protein [Phycisphaerae bacterium]
MKRFCLPILLVGFLLVGCSENEPPPAADGRGAERPDDPQGSQTPEKPRPEASDVTIAPTSGAPARLDWNPSTGAMQAVNQPLIEVIRTAWPRQERIVDSQALPEGNFDVTVAAQDRPLTAWRKLQARLEEQFDLQFALVSTPTEVWLLQRQPDAPMSLTPSDEKRQGNWVDLDEGWSFAACSTDALVWRIEQILGEPVIDQTGLEGLYDFLLPVDHKDPQSVFPGVEKLGLRLVQETQPLRRIVIGKQP